ncbi:type II toxin-antitoxin system VapC family toxin [Zoogloea sp.]|jgi:tRNA(fMet)-specific endonuclease VapC|uniref:type II toxin-antitoxin system VapC family toxin n=1 Tax=Zoogloea sp. TaxID=49181 RepID=UPI0011DB4839|nr:type II toxin-antitoxin system VapC family toxin [Zoogloea sp.]MBK6652466.1 type II toxin-antitoxin system VapC family toxin [Zoogloea sp.]MBK7847790.1 type II toxin-antitoxin system VapC family toxin [Zoogloea sp.]TXG99229.1 MAG: type II toxin-antitoxin system VapC family toxin [Zoogloea sp.]HPI61513.1 type II toxin-antitoxin system VapC family toxin [Zoogloea sp.]HRH73318.1 type II toxin-antitoxin system VapC family toxin [Zoogloea sp.]
MRYLLDTNIVSEAARPAPHRGVLEALERNAAECAISAVSWHELLFGAERLEDGGRRRQILAFIDEVASLFPVLPYDAGPAAWHATERARLARTGQMPAFADGQIAATASHHKLILVTRNVRDFTPFAGLVIENWFEH